MVHGGLRYLENGEFKLVQESLVERDRLLRNAPHYVAPLPTTVPVFDIFSGLGNGLVRFLGLSRRPSRRGAIAIKAGLSIYDFLTRKRAMMPRHQFRGRRSTLSKWPALHPGIKSSATYFDAWVSHPERLGMELLQDGLVATPAAAALNYAELRRTQDGLYRLQDQIGGASVVVEPALIINATGGWIDIANQSLFSPEALPAPLMGGTKGSHLIIDNDALRDALADHMIYYENEDGRICILFPYLGKVLVGSTDIRVDDPETVRCEADERDYILQSLAFVLPDIKIRPEDIVFQFAGVRPAAGQYRQLYRPYSARSLLHARGTQGWRRAGLVHDRRQVDDISVLRGDWPPIWRSNGLASARRSSTAERPIGGGRDLSRRMLPSGLANAATATWASRGAAWRSCLSVMAPMREAVAALHCGRAPTHVAAACWHIRFANCNSSSAAKRSNISTICCLRRTALDDFGRTVAGYGGRCDRSAGSRKNTGHAAQQHRRAQPFSHPYAPGAMASTEDMPSARNEPRS